MNAVDVSVDKNLVFVADDFGFLNILVYPCVIKHAPRKLYNGHSSFVQNVKILPGAKSVATVGGNDGALIVWDIVDAPEGSSAPTSGSWDNHLGGAERGGRAKR